MKKSHGIWHGLLMLVGCIVPMVLLVTLLGRRSAGASSNLWWVFLVICPLLHIFMMKGMMGGHKHEDEKRPSDSN